MRADETSAGAVVDVQPQSSDAGGDSRGATRRRAPPAMAAPSDGMDVQTHSVQESSDMSISSDDDGIEQQKKSSVELEENQGATQDDVLLEDPELGMTFDTEDDVREYYKNYAKLKGFGVTRRSSNRDHNGELRWCLWHIMKKLPEKLGGYDEYEYIKTAIGKAVYDSLTVIDFEDSWMRMLERYNIVDNEWPKGLYDNRHRWVPAFVKDAFWAATRTKSSPRLPPVVQQLARRRLPSSSSPRRRRFPLSSTPLDIQQLARETSSARPAAHRGDGACRPAATDNGRADARSRRDAASLRPQEIGLGIYLA
ncbi:hypothetical protein QYE76_026677 [Lolium multiflorum]|uniref:Protein FAR1-RELATED SEQUENCE n=1 Tax=Lolium multiflorum TaxID=4521 RepID=A0AAD8RI12_LOLMU|nr:hypothetical protein QYE76_026677 [Lolium multiflorum]